MEVTVDALKPGNVIMSEIKDASGKVVVKPGTKLTPLLLKRLITWGIKAVEIEGEGAAAEAKEEKPKAAAEDASKKPQNIDKELVIKIAKKFSKVREDPLMDKIMRLAIKNLSNRNKSSAE